MKGIVMKFSRLFSVASFIMFVFNYSYIYSEERVNVFTREHRYFNTDTSNLYIAIPGTHHSIEVVFPYDNWYGILPSNDSKNGMKVSMHFFETLPDDNPDYRHLQFKSNGTIVEPIFAIANHKQPDKINTFYYRQNRIYPSSLEFDYQTKKGHFSIKQNRLIGKSELGNQLSIRTENKSYNFDSTERKHLYWMGDLNFDEIPDFIIEHFVEAGWEYRLYVSVSYELMKYKVVAKFRTGGV